MASTQSMASETASQPSWSICTSWASAEVHRTHGLAVDIELQKKRSDLGTCSDFGLISPRRRDHRRPQRHARHGQLTEAAIFRLAVMRAAFLGGTLSGVLPRSALRWLGFGMNSR